MNGGGIGSGGCQRHGETGLSGVTMAEQQHIGFEGYEVERVDHADPGMSGYVVRGKRGAVYDLIRNQRTPNLLFAMNRKFTGKAAVINGVSWWLEENGVLRPVRMP